MLPLFRQKLKKQETLNYFLENGSSLLEELIALFGGRYKNPVRCFTAGELISATNNFTERIYLTNCMFQGFLEEKPVLVKRFSDKDISPSTFHGAIRDIAVSSQMSHLRNILKLRGCCMEFKFPALVYESAGTDLLADILHRDPDEEKLLSWKKRLQIAKGIANAIAYLHNAFPTPITFRNLKPSKVIIDKDGIPKLFDFSLSISLPPGESQVEDVVVGTWGFVDPEYLESGIVTEKSDVYSFGVLLLVLLTREEVVCKNQGGEKIDSGICKTPR
ncbi:hypothetical protein ACH5RR_034119 [Cinchona calisaya]|uniref:Protein kinase domain-containing protein n=1 Tax=Cinchona calisaya TaxID=153742 RepID=A0ABD2YBB0_9GENT